MSESENVEETELEHLARQFHEWYEANAREMGWETRAASRTAWEELPAANRTLTRATVDHVIGPLLADRDRLRARVAELEAGIRACFDESDLMPLAGVEGDRWYRVDRAGCKATVSGISTLETQELRRLVPRLAEEEQP